MKPSALGIALIVVALAPAVRAAVPAGYAGTPFGGVPWPVPGRLEFENYDDGGPVTQATESRCRAAR